MEGDYLIACMEELPRSFNPTDYDMVWCDESELRYFDRTERRLIKLVLNQKDIAEFVTQFPVKFPIMRI